MYRKKNDGVRNLLGVAGEPIWWLVVPSLAYDVATDEGLVASVPAFLHETSAKADRDGQSKTPGCALQVRRTAQMGATVLIRFGKFRMYPRLARTRQEGE